MRKVKFRFWLENKMQGILELNQGGILDMAWEWDKVDHFTGLLDSQGKEIYEGDILDYGDNFNSVVIWDKGDFRWGIRELKCIKGEGCKREHHLVAYTYKPTVLGNIHQNPELLKGATNGR